MSVPAINEAARLFKTAFGHAPTRCVRAPGRLELLGNHTDYNQGFALALAVDKYIYIAASPRPDGKIELVSAAFPGRETFFVSRLARNPAAPWADYVKGVLAQLQRRKIGVGGFNAAIAGNLPLGAGLSSSAALEVATALIARELYPYTATETASTAPPKRDKRGRLRALKPEERLTLARLCQAAENQFVGAPCGLMDQLSSLCGRAFHALMIDFQRTTVERAPMIGEISIVVCQSGVRHELTGGEYAELRQQCEGAAAALGVRSLREADMPRLKARRARLTQRQYECARHVIGENLRVQHGETALREDDFEQFGQFMFQSHESSRDFLRNSAPELDLLVELARRHPATFGARLTGGGFGGATINLVKRGSVELFMEYMAAAYEKKSGVKMTPLLCQIVDGAA